MERIRTEIWIVLGIFIFVGASLGIFMCQHRVAKAESGIHVHEIPLKRLINEPKLFCPGIYVRTIAYAFVDGGNLESKNYQLAAEQGPHSYKDATISWVGLPEKMAIASGSETIAEGIWRHKNGKYFIEYKNLSKGGNSNVK